MRLPDNGRDTLTGISSKRRQGSLLAGAWWGRHRPSGTVPPGQYQGSFVNMVADWVFQQLLAVGLALPPWEEAIKICDPVLPKAIGLCFIIST